MMQSSEADSSDVASDAKRQPMMGAPPDQAVLARVGADRDFDLGHALRWAAKARQISVTRLAFDIVRRQVGRQKLTAKDYFHFGLHLDRFTNAVRAEYLGDGATRLLNRSLADQTTVEIWRDKVLAADVLRQAGLPTPEIRAVFAPMGRPGAFRHLITEQDLVTYLAQDAVVPFFGKPVRSKAGIGAASFVARDAQNRLILGDGRVVDAAALAREILLTYPQGYMFQDKMRQHRDLAALAGPVMCSLRVMSLWVGGRYVALYSNMRLPAPGAMLDITCTSSAAIGLADGRILRTQDGRRLGGHSLEISHVTGARLIGAQLPHWDRVIALSQAAHGLFPAQGVLGIDIALTEDGPTIVELNAGPGHGGHHQTNDRGILKPEFRALFAAALAERGITKRGRGMLVP